MVVLVSSADVLVSTAAIAAAAVCVAQRLWPPSTGRASLLAAYLNIASGGVFLGTAVFHILPEAAQHDYPVFGRQTAYLAFILGLMFMMFFDKGWTVMSLRLADGKPSRRRPRSEPESPSIRGKRSPPPELVVPSSDGRRKVQKPATTEDDSVVLDTTNPDSPLMPITTDRPETVPLAPLLLSPEPEEKGRAESDDDDSDPGRDWTIGEDHIQSDAVTVPADRFGEFHKLQYAFRKLQRQRMVLYTSCVAIAFHSWIEGMILGAQDLSGGVLILALFFALHKCIDTIAMVSQLLRLHAPVWVYWGVCLLYTFMSPIGVVMGDRVLKGALPSIWLYLISAFGSGSFVYMALFSILQPELDFERDQRPRHPLRKLLALLVVLLLLFGSSVVV